LRISFQEYDTTSKERGTFVTNLGMMDILFQNDTGVGNRTATEMKEDSYFFFPQFYDYLTEQKRINETGWLDNHLRAQLKRAMAHVIRITQETYWRKSSVSELYGVDFMMDDHLNLWFIEANAKPLIKGWDNKTDAFFDQLLLDSIEISVGLLRSRSKRIIDYINGLIKNTDTWVVDDKDHLDVINLEERREEFKEISKNRFEEEFKPNSTNGFHLIVDENFKNTKRYMELIDKECL